MAGRRSRMTLMAAALMAGAGLTGGVAGAADNGLDPLAEFASYPPAIKGERCVAPVEIMRRRHMDLLDLQKDRAIVRGLRNQRFSLQQCVDCHAGAGQESARATGAAKALRIDAPGQFCAGCHEYVGIRIDCFSCHAATPRVDDGKNVDGAQRLSAHAFSMAPGWTSGHLPGVAGD